MRARLIASVWSAKADRRRLDAIRIIRPMTAIGSRIGETGTLIFHGGNFHLRRDAGGRYQLELQRAPANLVEKRVRLRGTLVARGLVAAEGVEPA